MIHFSDLLSLSSLDKAEKNIVLYGMLLVKYPKIQDQAALSRFVLKSLAKYMFCGLPLSSMHAKIFLLWASQSFQVVSLQIELSNKDPVNYSRNNNCICVVVYYSKTLL